MRLLFNLVFLVLFIISTHIYSRNLTTPGAHSHSSRHRKAIHIDAPAIKNDPPSEISRIFSLMVRVLIDEGITIASKKIELHAEHGFVIISLDDQQKRKMISGHRLTLEFSSKGELFVHGKLCNQQKIAVKPVSGALRYGDCSYNGFFWLIQEGGHWFLINVVDLEEYVYSVVRWESWPGWPLEVNKAFAIASRSYVMARITQTKKTKALYHIKNSNIHQTYKGIHPDEKLRRAVEETHGLIMTYNNQPIEAMFDCCCGGVIPGKTDYVDFVKAPYLARMYPCTFCKTCKIYSWTIEYDVDEFCSLLKENGHIIDAIRDVKVIERDAGGIVKQIAIKGKKQMLKLTGKQFYAAFSQVRSFSYSMSKQGKKIRIQGKGYGHHVGICQWGARNMIDIGWNYTNILKFYYPGIRFMRLT